MLFYKMLHVLNSSIRIMQLLRLEYTKFITKGSIFYQKFIARFGDIKNTSLFCFFRLFYKRYHPKLIRIREE